MKRLINVLMLVMVLAISLIGCQSSEVQPASEEEEVVQSIIHIYTTEETFEQKLEYVWAKHEGWKERVEVIVLPKEGYADTITALMNGPLPVAESKEGEEQADEPQEYKYPDIILVDSSDLYNFVSSEGILAVSEYGIEDKNLEQMYEYTLKEATDEAGDIKGLTWQANPGAFIYSKSLAMDILGYDDEDNVQSYLKDWDTLIDTARTIDKKTSGSVKILDKVDYNSMDCDISAINMSDNNYFMSVNLGKVFGYFCSVDMIEKFDKACKGSSRGDWAICKGPQSFVGNSTWMMVADKCSDRELAGNIIKVICCESDIQKKLLYNENIFVNNKKQISNAYNSGKGKIEIFGGSDYLKVYDKAAIKAGQE